MTDPRATDASALPRELPGGVREGDAALGVDALAGVRARIAAEIDQTQGAWARLPWWRRALPLAGAVVASGAFVGWLIHDGGVCASGLIASAAALVAVVAVMQAPRLPGQAERIAYVALVSGALALAAEVALARFAAEPVAGGVGGLCAASICLGAIAPAALLALYLRSSRAPARTAHVAACAGAAFLAAAGAVWAECPATNGVHVFGAHSLVPLAAAALVVLLLRPLLRGRAINGA